MVNIEVLELRRRLSLRKEKYKNGLSKLVRYFGIDYDLYLKRYDEMSEVMIDLGMKLKEIEKEMSEVDNEFERFKKSLLLKENINLKDQLSRFEIGVRGKVLDDLFNEGFIGNEEWEILKNWLWENRYRKVYSD